MPRTTFIVLLGLAAGLIVPASADTIVYRGREYTGVVIEELSNQYVVHFPDTGRKKYLRKEEVSAVEIFGERPQGARSDRTQGALVFEADSAEHGPETTDLTRQQSALQQYKERRRIRGQAEFEAAYEHWTQLPEEQRAALLAQTEAQAVAAETEMQQTAAMVAQARQQLEQERETIRTSIEGAATERDLLLDENYTYVFEGPPLEPYEFLSERDAEQAEAMDYIAEVTYEGLPAGAAEEFADDYWDWSGSRPGYGWRWFEDELDAADEEAYWIEEEYNARIAEESRVLQQIAEEAQQFERRSNTMLQRVTERANRLAGTANYLFALEDARAREFAPSLQYRTLFSIAGRGVMQRPVSTASPVLRIDWWVDVSEPLASQLKIRVYDTATDRPVKTDSSAKLPSDHFLLIDRPGDYLVEAEAPDGVTYTLEARELRDFEYVPVAKGE